MSHATSPTPQPQVTGRPASSHAPLPSAARGRPGRTTPPPRKLALALALALTPAAAAPGCLRATTPEVTTGADTAAAHDGQGPADTGPDLKTDGGLLPLDAGPAADAGTAPLCCMMPADCPEGSVCAYDGTCLPRLPVDAPGLGDPCWTDGDCDCGWTDCDSLPQRFCEGPSYCSCNKQAPCVPGSPTPGRCAPLAPPDACCSADAQCGPGMECTRSPLDPPGTVGACKPIPDAIAGPGACWADADCQPTQTCQGAAVCPCDADCDMMDKPGQCVSPAGSPADGCCDLHGRCDAPGDLCVGTPSPVVGSATCAPVPAPGRCWEDAMCAPGDFCYNAALCPCGADCDGQWPGVCAHQAGECLVIPPTAIENVCDAASLVVWNGTSCVQLPPGACGCDPFCDAVFQSLQACQQACLP